MTTPRSARGKGKEAGPVTNEPAPEDSLEGYGGRGSSQDPQSGRMAGDRQGATGWRDRAYEGGEPDELTLFGTNLASAAWPAFLAAGIGAIVLGALLLAWPRETLAIVAVLIGVALIVTGILRLMDGFTSHEATGGKRVASVVVGLIAIVLGLYCIRHFHFTITALAIIVGLFWVIHGVSDIAVGLFAGRFPGRGLTVLGGLLSLAAGLILLFWPAISLTVLVAVIGIWLIVYGVLAAVLGFMLRRSGSGGSETGRLAAV
jgi:uncharacterized membrane protein HdeD (DUF308 family)